MGIHRKRVPTKSLKKFNKGEKKASFSYWWPIICETLSQLFKWILENLLIMKSRVKTSTKNIAASANEQLLLRCAMVRVSHFEISTCGFTGLENNISGEEKNPLKFMWFSNFAHKGCWLLETHFSICWWFDRLVLGLAQQLTNTCMLLIFGEVD